MSKLGWDFEGGLMVLLFFHPTATGWNLEEKMATHFN